MDEPQQIPQLSNEIIARIIDFLVPDIQSLKSCSLTNSSFLYPARKHIFYQVQISIRTCMRFLPFLDANPSLGIHVRELIITASNPMEYEDTWVDKYLPLWAPYLPNVTLLELKGKTFRYKAAPFRAFQSVKRLNIIRTEINDMNDLCAFYGMFPLLETAFFHDIFVYRIPTKDVTITAYNPPKALKWTQFNSCRLDPGQLVDWTFKTDMHGHMDRIGVCPLQLVGMPSIGSLVAATGPALKRFKLALVGMVAQGGFVEAVRSHFRLDRNPNLGKVEFGSPAQYADLYGSDDIGISWFPTILSTIVSTVVEDVVFNLWGGKDDIHNVNSEKTGDLEMINSHHWDEVVDILSGAPFIGVKKIVFHISGKRNNASAMADVVKKRFTRFDSMGILFIDDEVDRDGQ